ncbi:DNA replication/repair protein RecF [Alkalilimnicola sp. S0819]|uniref:DNA replication/repair protein RecF n=1 Tax=Alkalilimnicola sp. S0819 TaxID=2613922 RepID=UPI001262A984|nr:DNA replication/repair protein RecF [Alkalilimnicola sp. S0819]KAB7624233.1 DNA replication/repair protein RecF [Alkalilimnicola sp. S0819]MPQ16488.1 DNA replication/repair protein RecF [Alkalilimnicola sp. S0819]
MSLQSLHVQDFRNLARVDLEFGRLNIVAGPNAAGKTSLLEAIYYLARARSFRSARPEQLLRTGAQQLLVRGEVALRSGRRVKAGILRAERQTEVHLNGARVRNLSELAQYFPVEVINGESQRLLQDGPPVRRSFMNWGMFHVEHNYQSLWQRYDRALRQRNAALRVGDMRQARAWEPEMAEVGEALADLREKFCTALWQQAAPYLDEWLAGCDMALQHRPGWDRRMGLGEALAQGRGRDLELRYTVRGPQRGDLWLRSAGVEAQHRLSRGQQKLAVVALKLALAGLQASTAPALPILLVDDLPAELDTQRREQVLQALLACGSQCFVTCVDADELKLDADEVRMFHVEHGQYRKVL